MKPSRPKCILNFGWFAAALSPLENTDKTSHFRLLSDAILRYEGDSQFVPGLRAQCGGSTASSEAPQNKMHNTLKEDADNGALSKQTPSWNLSHNIKPHLSLIFRPRLSQAVARPHDCGGGTCFMYFLLPTLPHPPSQTVTVRPV